VVNAGRREDFEALVGDALREIPERFQHLMENVVVVVEAHARPERGAELGIRRHQVLLGLYEGVPRTARGPYYSLVLPDKITIFQEPIEALGRTPEGIRELVRDTVWHEVAHHFGADDERIRRAERRRRTSKTLNPHS
jgi:predicted Zn-dependent protease with MMP-like domain